MRIATTKRNTIVLEKVLFSSNEPIKNKLLEEGSELLSKSKLLVKRIDDSATDQTQLHEHERLAHLKEMVDRALEKNSVELEKVSIHQAEILSQISDQSDMAIRKLLLELETGGNVRFEDEQQGDAWVAECEALVKFFIKTSLAEPRRTVQIHRISRLHNRHLKMKFEDSLRQNSRGNPVYLCFHGKQNNSDDVFSVVEHGRQINPDTGEFSEQVLLSNYLECNEDATKQKILRQAVIVRVHLENCRSVSEDDIDSLKESKDALNGLDAVFCSLARPGSDGIESPFKYCVSSAKRTILPEYFIEYSLESDWDKYTTSLEKILVDIAYSNRISHAEMPAIVHTMLSQIQDSVNVKMSNMALDIPGIDENLKKLELNESKPLNSYLDVTANAINLSGFKLVSVIDSWSRFKNLKSLTITHAGLDMFPDISTCQSLEFLDLSFNKLRNIRNMENMTNMRSLLLVKNEISSLKSLEVLWNTPIFRLDLRYNQVEKIKGFANYVASKCPRITWLNNKEIQYCDIVIGKQDTEEILHINSSSQSYLQRPLTMRTLYGYGSRSTEKEYVHLAPRSLIDSTHLTTIELDNCSLFDLNGLPDS